MAADIVQMVEDLTGKLTALAWALFLLSWSIGWTLRGSPIPSSRIKRVGNSLIEDSMWAALWLALGTTVFAVIVRLAGIVNEVLLGGG
ncbi:hypothetical protein APE_0220a [Aeropyrum pernix K1]|uniref:Uncharacterized protein n=3 Tax=Aeropyrum pernix TaxID=56636 RepID=Q05E88_AERPE|nr:DNA import protein CedA1 [Aeropyrum pernix]BAF34713.1 hypothetical protein APE_0220a [Aeropyrum pernix K1]GBF09767.1 hypothetical protein apy_14920 [Aeropyrum pernix]